MQSPRMKPRLHVETCFMKRQRFFPPQSQLRQNTETPCGPPKVRPLMKRGATFPSDGDVNYYLTAADLNVFAGEDA